MTSLRLSAGCSVIMVTNGNMFLVMDIPLLHFRLLGGNTRRDIRSAASCDAFDGVCKKLVGFYPAIFPSGCSTPSDVDLVTVDVPLEGGMRVHCTYFKAVEARAFWNVFCFSYSVSDSTEDMRQALLDANAAEWHQALCDLIPSCRSIRLDLPRRQPGRSLWSGQGCYIESFPMPNGSPFTCKGEDIDWERKLQLPRPSMEAGTKIPLPTQAQSAVSPRRKPRPIFSHLLLFLIGGGMGWYTADTAQSWKEAKLAEQARQIRQLEAQIRNTERLLQQKVPHPPVAPVSGPRETQMPQQ